MTSTRFGRRVLTLGVGLAILLTSSAAAMAATGGTESAAAARNTAASTQSGPARAALARVDAIHKARVSPDTALFNTYVPENVIGYECDYGPNWNAPSVQTPITGFANECNYRVWLHQDAWNGKNWGSGWTYCTSPGQYMPVNTLPTQYRYPRNIYVSTNPNPC